VLVAHRRFEMGRAEYISPRESKSRRSSSRPPVRRRLSPSSDIKRTDCHVSVYDRALEPLEPDRNEMSHSNNDLNGAHQRLKVRGRDLDSPGQNRLLQNRQYDKRSRLLTPGPQPTLNFMSHYDGS
jgi:hypothetical protein